MSGNMQTYDVVWPLGRKTVSASVDAARLTTLEGKTICELWNYLYLGDQCFSLIEEGLRKLYPKIKFIPYGKFGNTHGKNEREVTRALAGKLAEYRCDAVISGIGG